MRLNDEYVGDQLLYRIKKYEQDEKVKKGIENNILELQTGFNRSEIIQAKTQFYRENLKKSIL